MLDVMFDADIVDRDDVNPAPQPNAGIAFANLGPHQCRWPLETPQERGPWLPTRVSVLWAPHSLHCASWMRLFKLLSKT
jgi:hypothetical protein